MLEIALNNIQKNYGGKNVLNQFSLEIYTKERVAIVGPNGCGKTTLLSLISKEELPNQGEVSVRNKATLGVLRQIQKHYEDNYTLEEFLYSSISDVLVFEKRLIEQGDKLGTSKNLEKDLENYAKLQLQFEDMGGYEALERVQSVRKGLKIPDALLSSPFNRLSGGEKTISALAALLIQSPDILLLDEPTNHLDIQTIEWLESFLKGYKGTVVIVSHDRSFIDSVATKIINIMNGQEDIYFGNYSYFLVERIKRREILEAEYKNQEKKVDTMKKQAAQLRQWAHIGDNEDLYKKAKTIEKRLSKMDLMERPKEDAQIDIHFEASQRTGNDVIKVKNLDISTNRLLLADVSFDIYYQERVGIIGPNGCGKSTLIKMLMDKKENQHIKIGSNVSFGYIPQEVTFEDGNRTVLEEAKRFFYGVESDLRRLLARYYFMKEDIFKRVKSLSGGEKVRLKLLELILSGHNVLIFDEPTNHIDIQTKEILEQAIIESKGTVLFVSHDRYFIDKVATKLLICEEGTVFEFLGNYTDYKKYI